MVAVIHCINRFWATGPHPSRVTLSSCCPLTPSAPRVTARALDVESGFVSAGWWLSPTPLKNMKVKWEYDSQYMEKSKMFQTTNQSECCSWGWMVSGFENTNRNACSTKTYQDYIINIIYIYIYYSCQSSGPRFSKTDSSSGQHPEIPDINVENQEFNAR